MIENFYKLKKAFLIFGAVAALVLFGKASPVLAIYTYYVDIGGGSDANSGLSPTNAWKTLHKAAASVAAGDSIMVAPGVYSVANGEDDATLTVAASNVTIESKGREGAVIDGAGAESWKTGMNVTANDVQIFGLYFKNFDKGVSVSNVSTATVGGSLFKQNTVGIYTEATSVFTVSPKLEKNVLDGNTTAISITASGGAIMPSVVNNLMINNGDKGVDLNGQGGFIGPEIFHNTIDSGSQFGVYTLETVSPGSMAPKIKYNNITNFGQGGIKQDGLGTLTLDYNDVWNNGPTGVSNYIGTGAGTNDISQDPKYERKRLTAGSPCIDAVPDADNVLDDDLDGRLRPNGANKDIGCFEYYAKQTVTKTFNPGTTANDYTIAAVPLDLLGMTPEEFLGPQIGTYDPTLMRIGHYDPYTMTYEEYPFSSAMDGHDFVRPGEAAWFLFRNGKTLSFSGLTPVLHNDPFYGQPAVPINLEPGWNQVGNPFNHPVAIANMSVYDHSTLTKENFTAASPVHTQGVFWGYKNGAYASITKLDVGEGGWVKKTSSGSGELWVLDITVAFPDVDGMESAEALNDAPADVEMPPDPPGGVVSSGGGGDSGGGGGGGCFIGILSE